MCHVRTLKNPIVPRKWQRVESSNININDIPDHDINVQPQELSKRMQHLSNVLNHYWKR